jgi:hypothetical protein
MRRASPTQEVDRTAPRVLLPTAPSAVAPGQGATGAAGGGATGWIEKAHARDWEWHGKRHADREARQSRRELEATIAEWERELWTPVAARQRIEAETFPSCDRRIELEDQMGRSMSEPA